jgi:hypothetical protein
MKCQEVMELMQRHVDGDLNAEETSLMLDHVGHCPDCAAMLKRLLHLSRGLEQLPRVAPPYSLVDAILPELGNWEAAGAETAEATPALAPALAPAVAPRERRASRSRREWIGRLSGVAAVAAVVGLLLVGGLNLFPLGVGSSQKDAAPEASPEKATTFSASADPQQGLSPRADLNGTSPVAPKSTVPVHPVPTPKSEPKPSGFGASGGGSKSLAPSPHPSPTPAETPVPTSEPDQGAGTPRATDSIRDKGGAVNPSDPAAPTPTTPPTMGIRRQTAEQAVSPDGQWKAVVADGKLQLIRVNDGSVVYESASDGGTRSGLTWKDDSTAVTYTYTDADGNSSNMSFSVSEMKEQTAP